MATVAVEGRDVVVRLSRWERPFAGGRSELIIPLAAVRAAEWVERPTRWSATPGARAGLLVTGVLKLGRWGLGTGTHRFVSVRRWVPALRVTVDDAQVGRLGYGEILVSAPDAERLAAELAPA